MGRKLLQVSPLFLFYIILLSILTERISIPKYSISFFRIIILIILIIFMIKVIQFKKIKLPKELVILSCIILLPSIINISSIKVNVYFQYLFCIIIALLAYNLLPNKITLYHKTNIAWLLTIIALIGSITLITDYFGLTKFTLLFSKSVYYESQSGRGAGILGGETNFTAARLTSLIPFQLFLMLKKNVLKHSRLIVFPLFIVILLGTILTESRMGYLALIQIIIIVFFYEFHGSSWMTRTFITIGLFITIVIGIVSLNLLKDEKTTAERFESLQSINKIKTTTYSNKDFDDSFLNRFILFWIGIDIIKHHPIAGVGLGNAKYIPPRIFPFETKIKYLHNTYLEFGAENGLIPIILFISLLIWIFISFKKKKTLMNEPFQFYFLLSLYILCFNWLFLSDFTNKVFWAALLPLAVLMLHEEKAST